MDTKVQRLLDFAMCSFPDTSQKFTGYPFDDRDFFFLVYQFKVQFIILFFTVKIDTQDEFWVKLFYAYFLLHKLPLLKIKRTLIVNCKRNNLDFKERIAYQTKPNKEKVKKERKKKRYNESDVILKNNDSATGKSQT